MFKNKASLSLIFMILLDIWGCGTMAKENDTLSVPQKVSIEMPKALEVKATKNKKYLKVQKKESKKSTAYLALRDDVIFLEEQRVNVEINLLFINEIIFDIEQRCKDREKESICIIEENTLMFLFDQNLSNKLKTLSSENFGYELGDTLSFGKIEFTEHNTSNRYNYTLKMNTNFNSENSTSFERISWTKDEKLILSEYIEENSDVKNSIKINFSIKTDNSRKIVVDDSIFSKIDSSSDTFHFDMLKKADTAETYELNSTSLDIDSDANKNTFTSIGILSNLGGYLNFIGDFDGETFKENDTFDGNGNILSSSYCYSDMNCDLENEGDWLTD